MAFHEIRFPDNISRGARGGPERRTQVVELASGDEERNASWANSRQRYDVPYGIRRSDDLAAVVAFFAARNARLYGFRYKDWADYKSNLPSQAITPTDQQIGTGTGSLKTFQLAKRYNSGAQTWVRSIAKPVAGTVRVALGVVEQMSGWTLDSTTGVVTFTSARRPAFAPLVHSTVPAANQPVANVPMPEATNPRSRIRVRTAPLPLRADASRLTRQRPSPSAASQLA